VYFRDTAHGFLVWAVSLVITAAFLPMAITSMIHGAPRANSAASAGGTLDPNDYFVDMLLRPGPFNTGATPSEQNPGALHHEFELILTNALRRGSIAPADQTYLGQAVAAKTGISESDADKRVSDVFTQAQQAADAARKALAHTLYWAFLALLIGAFCASLAATLGGKQRDRVIIV